MKAVKSLRSPENIIRVRVRVMVMVMVRVKSLRSPADRRLRCIIVSYSPQTPSLTLAWRKVEAHHVNFDKACSPAPPFRVSM